MSMPRPITTIAIASPRMPSTATFCSSVSIFAAVRNPGRAMAKTANSAAKTAKTMPCWPMFLIPIPASLYAFFCRRLARFDGQCKRPRRGVVLALRALPGIRLHGRLIFPGSGRNPLLRALRCTGGRSIVGRQTKKRAERGRRTNNGELLARAEERSCLIEGFGILDLGARDRQMRIDLAAIARSLIGQIVEMRLAQTGVAAK